MEWYENASEEQKKIFIIDCIMRDSGCSRENAEIFYKIAYDIDVDLWEFYEEDLKEYFGENETDNKKDWYPERDDEWCHRQGIM